MNFDSIDDKQLEKLRVKIVNEQKRREYSHLEELRSNLEQAAKAYIKEGGVIKFDVELYTDYEYTLEQLPTWDDIDKVAFNTENYNCCIVSF